MPTFETPVLMLISGALFATSACGANIAVPAGVTQSFSGSPAGVGSIVPNDTTSILKQLTKDVEIGSTVDRKNGDMGHAQSLWSDRPSNSRKGSCSFATSQTLQGTPEKARDRNTQSKTAL